MRLQSNRIIQHKRGYQMMNCWNVHVLFGYSKTAIPKCHIDWCIALKCGKIILNDMWICQYFIDSIDKNNILVKLIQGVSMSLSTISNLSPNLAKKKNQKRKQNREEREKKTIGHGYIENNNKRCILTGR